MAEADVQEIADQAPVPRRGIALAIIGVTLGLASLAFVWLQGDVDWLGSSEPPLEDLTPRTQEVATNTARVPEPPTDTEEVRTQSPATVAPADEGLSQDEIRRAERARLASESPLAPPVRDLSEMIRQRDTAEEQSPAAATPPVPSPPPLPPPPPPKHVLARGTVIPTVLESALDSDLPGLVRAKVSENVFDTLTGKHVLIPRGARLVGRYTQATEAGAKRLFVAWDDLRMPNGQPIALDDFSALGADGAAGLRGRRSSGLLPAFGAAILFDLAGNATQIITGQQTPDDRDDLGSLIAAATGSATERVADRYLGQLLSRGTRFRVKAGAIMNVLVESDLELPIAEPWS